MEDGKELKLNITAQDLEGKPLEIILREGIAPELPELNEPIKFSKRVSMRSISEYIMKRDFEDDPKANAAIVIFCAHPDRPSLEFHLNPNDQKANVLTSVLTKNPDLAAFSINKDVFFSAKELSALVRKYAHCFADVNDVKKLISSLQNFEVKYEQTVIKEDNRQGVTKDLVESAIKVHKGEIPKEFNLNMPLYLGTEKRAITLEIEIQKIERSNLPGFGFYSLDLELLLVQVAEETIYGEVEKIKDRFVCLELD